MQAAFFGFEIRDEAVDDAVYGTVFNLGQNLLVASN